MVSLDDLLISKPEDLNIDQLLASESMAGEEEEQTKTLQPHLSKQDVKSLVCKQKSTLTYFILISNNPSNMYSLYRNFT